MGEESTERSLLSRAIGMGKDLITLLRDASLLVLAGLLILFPATFNRMLVDAGFKEGSIAGFKWEAKVLQADDALKNAQETITGLRAQLDKTTMALEEVRTAGDQAAATEIRKLTEENRKSAAASLRVTEAVRSTIAATAPLVERAQSSLGSEGGWGVVFGSDISIEAARDEIARASKRGIQPAKIYYRNGYFASIAVVDSRDQAQEYLSRAKEFRPDAYITPMDRWCRNPQAREGFTECLSRQ